MTGPVAFIRARLARAVATWRNARSPSAALRKAAHDASTVTQLFDSLPRVRRVDGDEASAPRDGSDGLCPSDRHGADRPAATVPGLAWLGYVNGRQSERRTYCLDCARAGRVFRIFIPDSTALRDQFDAWESSL